jgi:hypothetical protein
MECARIKVKLNRDNEAEFVKKQRLEKGRIRAQNWRINNPNHENTKIVKKRWKKENAGNIRAATIKRRLSKIHRTPNWLTEDDHWLIKEIYDLASLRSKLTKIKWHVDHILPLQGKYISGLHVPSNLQVIPSTLNICKANKFLP